MIQIYLDAAEGGGVERYSEYLKINKIIIFVILNLIQDKTNKLNRALNPEINSG